MDGIKKYFEKVCKALSTLRAVLIYLYVLLMIATDQGQSQVTGDCAVPFQDSGTEWGRGREEASRYYKRHFDPQHQSDVSRAGHRTFTPGLSVSQHL